MLRKIWFVAASVMIMLGLVTSVAFAQAGDVARGKALWEQKLCKNCHGANGEGAYAGPRAGDGKSPDDWIKQVRTPRANMPHFNDVQVSDQEIRDMWEYMQTLPKPTSFTPKQFELPANASEGQTLTAQKRCVACHGDFTQTLKFRFVAQKRTTVDAATVIKQLRTPFKNMPSFSATQVSDEQAAQIAAFLQSQLNSLSAAGAPSTLPVSGAQHPNTSLPLTLVLAGLIMLVLGFAVRVRQQA
ncbi:MAG: c-type cytochrome [Anaerolineae bacterium]